MQFTLITETNLYIILLYKVITMHISGGHKDKSVTRGSDCEVCPPNMCCSENAHSEHKKMK